MSSLANKDLRAEIREFLNERENLRLLAQIEFNRRNSGIDWPTLVLAVSRKAEPDNLVARAIVAGLDPAAAQSLEEAKTALETFLRQFSEWRNAHGDQAADARRRRRLAGGTS